MLSKAASSTIVWVFGITRSRIELWSPAPLVNTPFIRQVNTIKKWIQSRSKWILSRSKYIYNKKQCMKNFWNSIVIFYIKKLDDNFMIGCVLWHIKSCGLFSIKSCYYINIKYIWFVNEQFLGINFYTNQGSFISTLLNGFNTISFICLQLNGFKYCYLTLIILFATDEFFQYSTASYHENISS